MARRGRFVEIGPVIALSPRGRGLALPFPEDAGMGWGTEALWAVLESAGLRLGVVDAVLIRHLAPMASAYSREAEYARERAIIEALGVEDLTLLQRDDDRWYGWQRPRALRSTRDGH